MNLKISSYWVITSGELGLVLAKQYNWDYITNQEYITPQHLYFVSDREIKEGDYCHYKNGDSLEGIHHIKNGQYPKTMVRMKVEATTDPSLGLPLIPQSFIEDYVKDQGKIDNVDIETREIFAHENEGIVSKGFSIKKQEKNL